MIPRPKHYQDTEGVFSLLPVFPETEDGAAAARCLSRFLPALSLTVGALANVTLLLRSASTKGEYALTVTPTSVTASYGDFEGLRNAMATLASLYTEKGFSCAVVEDAPSYPFRSVLLDLARGYVELSVLHEHLVRMAYLKYNYVHLHLMDSKSYVMESDVIPNEDSYPHYTKDELRALCRFCAELAIEVIPEIEFPTHTTCLIRVLPELACDIIDPARARAVASVPRASQSLISADGAVSNWAICLGQDLTYEIYGRIIGEIAEVFPGEYIHVGGDEIAYPHLAAVPNWDNCHACRQRMEKMGITNTLGLYHDGFCRLHEVASAYGKQMIKWNEQEELGAPPPIPRDIVIEYWKPSVVDWAKGTEPCLVTSEINMLRNAGFRVFNAHYFYTYNDENQYMTTEKINGWTPDAGSHGVMGGETCAWELGNPRYAYYAHRLPLAMGLFSDRVWNRSTVPYDDGYRADLFAAVLGYRGLGAAPLSPLPAVLSPVPHSKGECIPPEPAYAGGALDSLSAVRGEAVYGRLFLEAYRLYLHSLIDGAKPACGGEKGFGENTDA